jgi:hypothetical protein
MGQAPFDHLSICVFAQQVLGGIMRKIRVVKHDQLIAMHGQNVATPLVIQLALVTAGDT